jgi:hypothetical protein
LAHAGGNPTKISMPSNDSAMSPELDLLGRLATSDLPLATAVTLFPRVDLAKKAVEVYVRSQTVELIRKREGVEVVVQPWRLRFLLNDPGTWKAASDGSAVYHLRLTPDAQDRFVADGPRFVQELFRAYSR